MMNRLKRQWCVVSIPTGKVVYSGPKLARVIDKLEPGTVWAEAECVFEATRKAARLALDYRDRGWKPLQ